MIGTGAKKLSSRMSLTAAFIVLAVSCHSQAAGLICQSVDQDLRIEVEYASATAEAIAETAVDHSVRVETMTVIDPTLSRRNQLIAKFSAADGSLRSGEGFVLAVLDSNPPPGFRAGKRVGGTVLGALASILLKIDGSYQERLAHGSRLSAQVEFTKWSGEELTQDFDCIRYSESKHRDSLLATFAQ